MTCSPTVPHNDVCLVWYGMVYSYIWVFWLVFYILQNSFISPAKCRKCYFRDSKIPKFFGGEFSPRTPLEVCRAFAAPLPHTHVLSIACLAPLLNILKETLVWTLYQSEPGLVWNRSKWDRSECEWTFNVILTMFNFVS